MARLTLLAHRFAGRTACTAALLATLACAAPPAMAGPDRAFDAAVKTYRAGRFSDAYGKFIPLANNGNADAARIVLFMYAHGPLLYGSAWDATAEDIELWSRLSGQNPARQPGYDPVLPNVATAAAPQPQAQQVRAAYRPRVTRFIPRTEQYEMKR
jgi:hypothetical protein